MSTPISYPVYHDLAKVDTATAAQCRRLCGFETAHSGVGRPKDKFPAVLHALLEKAEKDKFDDVICWQPHGRAFKIHNHVALEAVVMPKYLRRPIKYASFQRNLHLYGFLQLSTRGVDAGCYYHECFLRGRSDLCSLMQRATKSTYHVRQSRDPSTAPNFAAMFTTAEAQVALQVSKARTATNFASMFTTERTEAANTVRLSRARRNVTTSELTVRPSEAERGSHDSIILRNANEAMDLAVLPPHPMMDYHDATHSQYSLPDPYAVHGGRSANDIRHASAVASRDGDEDRSLLYDLRQRLDHSQQEFLCSLFGDEKKVAPSNEMVDSQTNDVAVSNEPLPWRTDATVPCKRPTSPDGALPDDSKLAAVPEKRRDEKGTQRSADAINNGLSHDETAAKSIEVDEPVAQNVALPSPEVAHAEEDETHVTLSPQVQMAADDELPREERVETLGKISVCGDDSAATAVSNGSVMFSMTDKLQGIIDEIQQSCTRKLAWSVLHDNAT